VDNRVYFRARNTVYSLTPGWDPISVFKGDPTKDRAWELSKDDGQPVLAPHRKREAPANRPAARGDLLFTDATTRPMRQVFYCSDGSTLRLVGDSLERLSPAGEVIARYGTPWYLQPFVFPFPGALAWLAWFIVPGYYANKADKASKNVTIDPTAPVRACLREKTWLTRVFDVTTPEGDYVVELDRRGIGERVRVNGEVVVSNLWWGNFKFPLGDRHVVMETRFNGYFYFTIDGQVVYHERPPEPSAGT
jgi:hypothetical protein